VVDLPFLCQKIIEKTKLWMKEYLVFLHQKKYSILCFKNVALL